MGNNRILEVYNLKKYFPLRRDLFGRPTSYLKAVDDVSFSIRRGETLGLVGESGCGKSTLGRTIIHLYKPTAGEVWFNGKAISSQTGKKELGCAMQMIFQDPYASLNPRMTVGDIVGEPLDIHGLPRTGKRTECIVDLLEMVGLNPQHANRFPHEFSGGQRQRVGIARALASKPSFIICDEGISALDVSIQAQIVNLLKSLQGELGLTCLFIAHDLAMVRHISNRVAVMYLGKMVEVADTWELYNKPQHPYTQALLASIPLHYATVGSTQEKNYLVGDIPSPSNRPSGCGFRTRCLYAEKICAEEEPILGDGGGRHMVACHLTHQR